MADYIKQIEPMIYYSQWQPRMSLETISADSDYVSQLADENHDTHYIIILDMTNTVDFALDIKNLTSIAKADHRTIAYVCINGDNTAKFIGGLLKHLAKQDFKFVDTYDDALQQAHTLLMQHA